MELQTKKKFDFRTIVIMILSVSWILFQLIVGFVGTVHPKILVPIHMCFALAIVFLYNPIDKKHAKLHCFRFVDWALIVLVVGVALYFLIETERLQTRVPYISPVLLIDKIVCFVTLALILEAIRRTFGLNLIIFIAVFVAYMWLGNYMPRWTGLRCRATNLDEFVQIMTMSSDGVFGTPLTTSAQYLFYFMVFGAMFSACGGGQLLIEIGLKFGKGTGGPAKAAVISSGLMGMISGAAVANVTTTGCMTIPMMMKTGYTPEQAGAIEALASTGGQIMPPVMGIGAFVMAEMLGMEYATIATSAIIPAVAFYLAVFLVVDFIARQTKQGVMSAGFQIDPILPRIYQLIPAIVLIIMIMSGFSLMRSALISTASILVLNIFNPKRASLKKIFEALLKSCKQAAGIAIPTAGAGIIIGAVVNSGLAAKLSNLIIQLGSTNLIYALLLSMVGCLLFGMALPTVAAYLLSAILFVPTLTSLGVGILPANMFVFYFGIFAQITPPVCLASFTAAGISGGNAWKTGWLSFRWALVAFLAAYAFVYNPALLLIGTVPEIIQATVYLFMGTAFMAAGMEGWIGVPVKNVFIKILLMASGAALIIPEIWSSIIGFAVGMTILLIYQVIELKKMDLSDPDEKTRFIRKIIVLSVLTLCGIMVVYPEFLTTIIAFGVLIALVVYLMVTRKKYKKAPETPVEVVTGEVIKQDLDAEDDDIVLTSMDGNDE